MSTQDTRRRVISCRGLGFQYESQKQATLSDINLDIYEGEKILILGASGSGKSTFARLINGLCPHAFRGEISGEMTLMGRDVRRENIFSRSTMVGTVLQDTDGQFIGLTVAEDIAFALENDGVESELMRQKVAYWAERVGLKALTGQRPQDLSGGQKQRVSMAGVLIDEVPILLFDEPLANLDPATGASAIELIDELHREQGVTVLMIEHRLEDVLHRNVDRILLFEDGRITADLSPQDLLCSDLLLKAGIREPLYLNALRYAGVALSELRGLASPETVEGEALGERLESWRRKHPAPTPVPAGESLLCIDRLNFSYSRDRAPVLSDVSINIGAGEMISLVGCNGAGKSTLAKAICGFLGRTEGSMYWEGQAMDGMSVKERAEHIGYVMQNPNQMISQTMIFDELALGLRLRGVPESEVRERVMETLQICGLYPFRSWPISALSYGQKKRVSIAAILALRPRLMLLDEPTAGQDFRNYTRMMDFLEMLNRRLGVTVVMVTHDMHLMLEYTRRALVMADGRIIADLPPETVLSDAALVEQASLKETSLFTLARRMNIAAPCDFIRDFIAYDREVRAHE